MDLGLVPAGTYTVKLRAPRPRRFRWWSRPRRGSRRRRRGRPKTPPVDLLIERRASVPVPSARLARALGDVLEVELVARRLRRARRRKRTILDGAARPAGRRQLPGAGGRRPGAGAASRSRCCRGGRGSAAAASRSPPTWRNAAGESGEAQLAQAPSTDSALYYFFDDSNWELQVKVLDGCAVNGHYWVFAAAASDVGIEATVTDLEAEPHLPLRQPARPSGGGRHLHQRLPLQLRSP